MSRVFLIRISFALFLVFGSAKAQLLEVELQPEIWGLEDSGAIRHGRLTVTHGQPEEMLQVTALSTAMPQPTIEPSPLTLEPSTPTPWHVVPRTGCLAIADTSSGQQNLLGGGLGVFQRSPSYARFDVDSRSHGRRSIAIDYERQEAGFAGLWMQLYDPHESPRNYLDLSASGALTLWVRGREGGEEVAIKVADRRLDELEDSLAIGALADFLPTGTIEPVWQVATIPIDSLPPQLDRRLIAGLAFEAIQGNGRIELGPIMACGEARPQLTPEPPEGPMHREPRELALATWVWNTIELLDNSVARTALFDRVEAEGVTDVYLQLPGETGRPASLQLASEQRSASFQRLVASLRGLGCRVSALDGHASFVYPKHREKLLEAVREIKSYNDSVPSWARIEGVHYDIEPYLLPEFGGARQGEVLTMWVQTIGALTLEARRTGLEIGVDLPFWLDGSDALGRSFPEVSFAGHRRSALAHLVRLVDTVVLMDYRTTAFGANGVLKHAREEIALVASQGKRILIGLETGALLDETYFDFFGEPASGLPPAGGDWVIAGSHSGRAGERILLVTGEIPTLPEGSWRHWPVKRRIEIPADMLTFANLGRARFDAVRRQVSWELDSESAFDGIAVHHAASLSELPP